jgi:5-methylcytosine-specific restriction endonuclease McrA
MSETIVASEHPLKTCCTCKVPKPASEFYADKRTPDGLYCRCKICHNAATSRYAKANKEKTAANARKWRAENPEKAKAVSLKSSLKRYAKDPEPQKARTKAWYAKNKARASEYHRQRRAIERDALIAYHKEYYLAHADDIKARSKKYSEDNRLAMRPAATARAQKRNATKINAFPAWANVVAIEELYALAAKMTEETGVRHEVDHIVPLTSDRVCGLHVEHNLKVITGDDNRSKSNRYWPKCPDDIIARLPARIRDKIAIACA